MSQSTFLNRQALFLRPDPSRVVVRPFKPATEPRDLNPTDKTRANHIVDRILALDLQAAESLLADILENFDGRHRNLLDVDPTCLRCTDLRPESGWLASCRLARALPGRYRHHSW